MDRRKFIRSSTIATLGVLTGNSAIKKGKSSNLRFPELSFGICADIHLDTVHDGKSRLSEFIDEMQVERPDFIIQLGDFCSPHRRNRSKMDIWDRFKGPKYHVIGNHDTDSINGSGRYSREQVVNFWKLKGRYYSFDKNGYHFMVLDGNETEYNSSKCPEETYGSYIGDDQLEWIRDDLNKTNLPTIIFIHQGLDNEIGGVENGSKVRYMLEKANEASNFPKVLMVFSGHHHKDYHNVINGIHYIQINSMSYNWIGNDYPHTPYTKKINNEFPLTKYTVPYKKPLWGFAEINTDGDFSLKGKESQFVGKSPAELGVPEYAQTYPIVPYISDRKLQFNLDP